MNKFIILILILLSGCAVIKPNTNVRPSYRIDVYREPDLSGIYEVDSSGMISFPLIGAIKIEGLSIPEIRLLLEESLSEYLIKPSLNISISTEKEPNVRRETIDRRL